jgi:hypothetical protein
MIDDMTVRNLSPATQQSYVYAVAKFSRFFGCSPDRLGIEEVRAYQLHLAGLGWSWSHINQVSCALRFFFGVTLGRPEAFDRIISAKEPKKMPLYVPQELEPPSAFGGAAPAKTSMLRSSGPSGTGATVETTIKVTGCSVRPPQSRLP